MVQYLNRIVIKIQPCQIRRVLEQVSVQRMYLIVAKIEGFQGYVAINSIVVRPLEDLASQYFT